MITLISISNDIVRWSDSDGEYKYPRFMFPEDLTLDSKVEFCAGCFTNIE